MWTIIAPGLIVLARRMCIVFGPNAIKFLARTFEKELAERCAEKKNK